MQNKEWTVNSEYLFYEDHKISLKNINLKGLHQLDNAALAAIGCLIVEKLKVKKSDIEKGIKDTKWNGRIQKLEGKLSKTYDDLDIWIDSAHNVLGFKSLLSWMKTYNTKQFLIISVGKNKDIKSIINEISYSKLIKIIILESNNDYFHNSYKIKKICDEFGLLSFIADDLDHALGYCLSTNIKARVVITGSIYFISDVIRLDKNL